MEFEKNNLQIPSCLTDVTSDWVAELLYQVIGVPRPSTTDGTHAGLTLLQIRASSGAGFRESCHVRARCSGSDDTYALLVEIVPADEELRAVVSRHRLLEKEILFHSRVLPCLRRYVQGRSRLAGHGGDVDVTFSVPKFVYGDYDEGSGNGVIVFEDFTEQGYEVRAKVVLRANLYSNCFILCRRKIPN